MKKKYHLNGKVVQHMMEWDRHSAKKTAALPAEENKPECDTRTRLKVAWRTDVGRVRANNQDAVIYSDILMGIADGMGGHNGGETASCGARDGIIQKLEGQKPAKALLEEAIREVNLQLYEQQCQDESLDGMGTTLTVLWVDRNETLIGHVGDSRAYLLRDGVMNQMTSDHSMVAEMVRKGLLTEEQAANHPMRNYITRAVGTERTIEVDLASVARKKGDRWLVCSDGLHGSVPFDHLREMLAGDDLQAAADRMLNEALDNGGRDNISLLLYEDEGVDA